MKIKIEKVREKWFAVLYNTNEDEGITICQKDIYSWIIAFVCQFKYLFPDCEFEDFCEKNDFQV